MKAVFDLFENTDYGLLQQQKEVLLNTVLKEGEDSNHETAFALDGLVHLIDAFQDAAVDYGIPEERVFPDVYKIE